MQNILEKEGKMIEARIVETLPEKRPDQLEKLYALANLADAPDRSSLNDASRMYRDEIGRVDLLSNEEVICLAQRIARGAGCRRTPPAAGASTVDRGGRAGQTQADRGQLAPGYLRGA